MWMILPSGSMTKVVRLATPLVASTPKSFAALRLEKSLAILKSGWMTLSAQYLMLGTLSVDAPITS
mgnify:CR=1 FL=1